MTTQYPIQPNLPYPKLINKQAKNTPLPGLIFNFFKIKEVNGQGGPLRKYSLFPICCIFANMKHIADDMETCGSDDKPHILAARSFSVDGKSSLSVQAFYQVFNHKIYP